MTTGGYKAGWRVACRFRRKNGFVAIDEIRTVDEARLVKRLGALDPDSAAAAVNALREMFAD